MDSTLTNLAVQRDDLRAAVNPLFTGLPAGVTDLATAPADDSDGWSVEPNLFAVLAVRPQRSPWKRRMTYRITAGFDPTTQIGVTVAGVAELLTPGDGQTITQALDALGAGAVANTAATAYELRDVDDGAGTGTLVLDAPNGSTFDGSAAAATIALTAEARQINVTLYGRLNDNASTAELRDDRSGWGLYARPPDGCLVAVAAGPDAEQPLLDVRPYRGLYPYVTQVLGVDGDGAAVVHPYNAGQVSIRPCALTYKRST